MSQTKKVPPEPTATRASIEKAIKVYYSALCDQEAIEQAEWGDFALAEFPGESFYI